MEQTKRAPKRNREHKNIFGEFNIVSQLLVEKET